VNSLHKQICQDVLGWAINRDYSPWTWSVPLDQHDYYMTYNGSAIHHTPDFTTYMNDAWHLVRAMMPKYWVSTKYPAAGQGDLEHWQVTFRPKDNPTLIFQAVDESEMMAICTAALNAVNTAKEAADGQ
jgi:hypothetical protein